MMSLGLFEPKIPCLVQMLSMSQIELSKHYNCNCAAFIEGLQHGVFKSMKKRSRFLEVLIKTHHFAFPPKHFRVEMFSEMLLWMMDDNQTSQEHHMLLARVINEDFFGLETREFFWKFALRVHMMLDEGKEEAWFYLRTIGDWLYNGNHSTLDEAMESFMNILQHLTTPLLILDKLEQNKRIKRLPSDRDGAVEISTKAMKMAISLRFIGIFAQYGRLVEWIERDLDYLLDIIRCVLALDCGCAIGDIANIFTALDSRELNKLDLSMFLSKIQKPNDVKTCGPLLKRLTSSPQFCDFVTTPRLMNLMLSAWKNDRNFVFQNPNLWDVWASLADVALSTTLHSEFFIIVIEKLQMFKRSKHASHIKQFRRSYDILHLKTSKIMMDPTHIRYTKDSIRSRFGDGKRVDDTKHALQSKEISPHRIPPINVFPWKGVVHTEDNRRLFVFKNAGLKRVPVQLTTRENIDSRKFTTTNDGTDIFIRYRPKSRNWRMVKKLIGTASSRLYEVGLRGNDEPGILV